MYTPPVTSLQFSVLGPLNRPSLFDIRLNDNAASLFGPAGTIFDGWCLAMNVFLDVNTASAGTVYSAYELGTLSAAGLPIGTGAGALNNLDSINWLLNAYDGSNYTWGEIQAAIWALIGDDWTMFSTALGNPDPARISALTGQALANDGFKPEAGQIMGVVLDVRDAAGNQQQPTLIEVRAAEMGDRVFEDKNANGVQDLGDQGVAGARVELVRDINGDGDFDDANELLAFGTTDVNGDYSFKGLTPGLDYQVRFVQPAGFDGASPRQAGPNTNEDSDGAVSDVQVLAPGEYRSSVDSGFYKFASLGDRVWLDGNGNGQQDFGEGGRAGVVVNLLNSAGTVIATQTTVAGGIYLFANLTPGSYSVEFQLPTGFGFTTVNAGDDNSDSDANQTTGRTDVYTLVSGQINRTADAGLVVQAPQVGRLSGTVFEDRDNNGSGDVPLGGVLIVLKNAAGVEVGRTTTAANGTYSFTGLQPGEYTVHQTNLAGYNDVGDIDGGDPNSIAATVPAGGQSTGNDFVDDRPAALGDRVWLDTNGNGQLDGAEAGVSGVTVNLLNAVGDVVNTQATDGTGNYLFTGLDAGTYSVQFVKPTGLEFTTANAGNDGSDSDANQTTGQTGTYTLASGETNRTADAGLVAPADDCVKVTFKFSGNTSTDGTDGNTRSWTDSTTGVMVTARAFSQNKDTNTFETAYLGAYGGGLGVTDRYEGSGSGTSHTVDNKDKNNYIVFQFSSAVEVDKAFLGYVAGDSDIQIWVGNSSSTLTSINQSTLSSAAFTEINLTTETGARWADLNAGEVKGNIFIIAADTTDTTPEDYFKVEQLTVCAPSTTPPPPPALKGSIGDRVWEDKDYDGVQDADEAGIKGVTVKLLNSSGAVVASTTTGDLGNYVFNGLDAGSYKVQVTKPSGYYVTKQDLGGNDANDSDINTSGVTGTISLGSGQAITNVDAGLYRKASIGDKVFADWDHDGYQDNGEGVVKDVKVFLQDSSGVTIASTTTDNKGMYKFVDLDPGTYRIGFDKSHGKHVADGKSVKTWSWAKVNVGGDDTRDSDATGSSTGIAYTTYTTLESGEYDNTWDVGVTPIVIDLDGNGIQTIARSNAGGTFDLFGNGNAVQSGWISGGDGFLAVDVDGNGKIDSGAELFGGTGKGAGYAKLGSYDSNGDGMVSLLDTDFAQLLVWQDSNGNHQTDDGELMTLAQAGVSSLSLSLVDQSFYVDSEGNVHGETSSATLASGQSVTMTDVYFSVDKSDALAAGASLPTIGELLGTGESELDALVGASASCAGSAPIGDDSCADAGEMLRQLSALSRADMEQQTSLAH